MLKTEVQSLQSILEKGKNRAITIQDKVLITYTEEISAEDPLVIFERMRKLEGDRSFWKSATEAFYIVTVGENLRLTSNDGNRYEYTFQSWKEIRESAIVYNPYHQEGTGLILTGGMSFDVKEEKTSLWERYPHSEFILPKFTFTKKGEEHYLTTAIYVTGETSIDKVTKEIEEEKRILLAKDLPLSHQNTIVEKIEVNPTRWKESVKRAIDYIKEKKAEKIVMARELRVRFSKKVEITPILKQLLLLQQTSYLFAYERGDHCFIGATPERLVKVQGEKLLSTCLAGTAPRGRTMEEDLAKASDLLKDNKNRLEHDHVVQMIRNSISEYCNFLNIPEEPEVITLKNLHHLYSPVVGELKQDYSVFDVIRRLHPTPALGGTPTEEALAFIRENEGFERGWYGSPVGWLDDRHNGEFAVAIRSGLIQADEISLFAGCGVMGDSDVELEFEETAIKFLPMLTALGDENESY